MSEPTEAQAGILFGAITNGYENPRWHRYQTFAAMRNQGWMSYNVDENRWYITEAGRAAWEQYRQRHPKSKWAVEMTKRETAPRISYE